MARLTIDREGACSDTTPLTPLNALDIVTLHGSMAIVVVCRRGNERGCIISSQNLAQAFSKSDFGILEVRLENGWPAFSSSNF